MTDLTAESCGIDLLPASIGFDDPASDLNQNWYLTLSIVLQDQTDQSLVNAIRELQDEVIQRVGDAGIATTGDPRDTDKLYIYPENTLHCSLLDWYFDPRPKSADDIEQRKEEPIWHKQEACPIKPFSAQARWFYAHPTNPTSNFSVQLLFPNSVTNELLQWSGFKSKIYCCGRPSFSRAVINIARFTKQGGGIVDGNVADAAKATMRDLNDRSNREPLASGTIDKFSFVKSDAWLSNESSQIKAFELSD